MATGWAMSTRWMNAWGGWLSCSEVDIDCHGWWLDGGVWFLDVQLTGVVSLERTTQIECCLAFCLQVTLGALLGGGGGLVCDCLGWFRWSSGYGKLCFRIFWPPKMFFTCSYSIASFPPAIHVSPTQRRGERKLDLFHQETHAQRWEHHVTVTWDHMWCICTAMCSVALTPFELQDLLSRQTINDVSVLDHLFTSWANTSMLQL